MDKLPKKISINLGDKRLNDRYKKMEAASFKQPSQSIPATFQNWHQAKAVYRFFDNPKVTHKKLIDHQYQQTKSHIQQLEKGEDILIIQDTTHLNYGGHQNKKELFSTHSYVKKGLKLHPSIALTPRTVE